MSLDDFLAPGLPGLIYETHSEQSQSPHSNGDLAAPEHDWAQWDDSSMNDNTLFADPHLPIFGDDELFQTFATSIGPYDTDMAAFAPRSTTNENPPAIVTPSMLMQKAMPPQQKATDLFPATTTGELRLNGKRKLSETSSDDASATESHGLADTGSPTHSTEQPERQTRKYGSNRAPKISHNVIEKRYRSKLNDKISDLRDAVPSLKAEAETGNVKHNKGRIIQGAAEYIREVERRCARLQEENSRLTAKLHAERQPKSGNTVAKVVVGGLASMMCASSLPTAASSTSSHAKRGLDELDGIVYGSGLLQNCLAIVKMILLIAAILYVFNPDLFSTPIDPARRHNNEKYSQSALEDSMQEDLQENREAVHDNISAMLKMPRDRPGLFTRILQGCFVLILETIIGQSGWNVLVNRGLDYAQKRQNACRMLIETQLLGGDKSINQAKLFLSAIQSLGYTMPKEMRALHFAMVCHGYVPASILQFFISLFWSTPTLHEDNAVLQLPLSELFSQRVLDAMWAWTTGIDDPLIANVRSDETIGNPLRQISSIHAALLQNVILRTWLRGVETTEEMEQKTRTLLLYSPKGSKILTNSIYLKSMIEPNDWLERAMIQSFSTKTDKDPSTVSHEVAMQLRCCVLLNLLEKDSKVEEVSDVLQMAEVETSSLLPDYSSRIVAKCIAKYRLDDEYGISEALRKICYMIASSTRLETGYGRLG